MSLFAWAGGARVVSCRVRDDRFVNASATMFLFLTLASVACIILGLVLFAMGVFSGDLSQSTDGESFDNWAPNYQENPDTHLTPTFWSLLALFFPSATGIMAGCNRSAVLVRRCVCVCVSREGRAGGGGAVAPPKGCL